jgi:hypothetical protein
MRLHCGCLVGYRAGQRKYSETGEKSFNGMEVFESFRKLAQRDNTNGHGLAPSQMQKSPGRPDAVGNKLPLILDNKTRIK